MKIVITGFEPFAKRSINASYEIVKRIQNVDVELLQVGWNQVAPKIGEILESNPDYLLLCGEAASYKNMTIEKVAHNISNGKDNYEIIKNEELIDIKGPKELYSTIDFGLFKNIDFLEGNDAGKYLCNYSYYNALLKAKGKNTKVVFIHFPLIKEQGGTFELNDLVNRLQEIVNILRG